MRLWIAKMDDDEGVSKKDDEIEPVISVAWPRRCAYVRSNVTNIRQGSFDLQVNECMAVLCIMGRLASRRAPSVASAMPSIPVSHVAPDHHQLFFRGVIVRREQRTGKELREGTWMHLCLDRVLARKL